MGCCRKGVICSGNGDGDEVGRVVDAFESVGCRGK